MAFESKQIRQIEPFKTYSKDPIFSTTNSYIRPRANFLICWILTSFLTALWGIYSLKEKLHRLAMMLLLVKCCDKKWLVYPAGNHKSQWLTLGSLPTKNLWADGWIGCGLRKLKAVLWIVECNQKICDYLFDPPY